MAKILAARAIAALSIGGAPATDTVNEMLTIVTTCAEQSANVTAIAAKLTAGMRGAVTQMETRSAGATEARESGGAAIRRSARNVAGCDEAHGDDECRDDTGGGDADRDGNDGERSPWNMTGGNDVERNDADGTDSNGHGTDSKRSHDDNSGAGDADRRKFARNYTDGVAVDGEHSRASPRRGKCNATSGREDGMCVQSGGDSDGGVNRGCGGDHVRNREGHVGGNCDAGGKREIQPERHGGTDADAARGETDTARASPRHPASTNSIVTTGIRFRSKTAEKPSAVSSKEAGEWGAERFRGSSSAVGGLRFAAKRTHEFGNGGTGKDVGQRILRIGLDGVGLAEFVAILKEPAREQRLSGLLEPLIHERGDFVAQVRGVIQPGQFEALEGGCRSLPEIVPRRVERL